MAPSQTTEYRYHSEQIILFLTELLVVALLILSSALPFHIALLFVLAVFVIAYISNQSNHQLLIRQAYRVTRASAPKLAALADECQKRLRPGPLDLFIVPNPALNAYTFGFGSTKVVVVYSALFKNMDEGEISFILGHEMGHVSLGHTRINSFIGGMAGIPAPWGISVILRGIFLSWNRACEYSADRAGLLACGNVNKAISALIKLGAGPGAHSQAELDRALKMLDEEDDNIFSLLGESLQTHPMLIKRIQQLLRYASSRNYEKLQVWVRQNPNIKKE